MLMSSQRPRPRDIWHYDAVFLKINGETQYLWRAVDQEGNVLDLLLQRHWNAMAAKKFFRALLEGCATCRGW
jgi:putative transposase